MASVLEDFPPGPLDFYRKKASFDWKQMKLFIDSPEMVDYENKLLQFLKTHPELQDISPAATIDEEKRRVAKQAAIVQNSELSNFHGMAKNPKRPCIHQRTMIYFNPSLCVKRLVGSYLFDYTILIQGTEKHRKYADMSQIGEIIGCFAMTEVGHGSNTKGIRTTATYDKDNQQFVLHTPDFQAAKCWIGGLGLTASYAIVYAQLYVQGTHHGLHLFLVPIRDPKTLLTYPGVIAGDVGEKIGLQGLDNGFAMFDHYSIARDFLLNKISDVTPEGEYVTHFKDPLLRHAAALSAVSIGRVHITSKCENYGAKALTIAIRYAAVRRQFGPDGGPETPILEYQSHQYRLLPYLAGAYVVRCFSMFLFETKYRLASNLLSADNNEQLLFDLGLEIHVVSSASKPVSSWLFRDAIQECREACGGHGYLKAAGIGDIRNDHEVCCTYEGDGHVLIQQTSTWLLKLWPRIAAGKIIATPLKSADFFSNTFNILKRKFTANTLEEVAGTGTIMDAYQWVTCYLLQQTKTKFEVEFQQHGDLIRSKNNTQVFYAKNLAIAFIQHFFLQHFLGVIAKASDNKIKHVLLKLFSLYGLWSLEKFLPYLYEGGYARGPKASYLMHEAVLKLCSELKDEAVTLIDAIAPPDFLLNSVLGASDGQVYKRLQAALFSNPYSMVRPSWWRDVVKNKL